MRIGQPSFDSALVAANVAVALCLGVVYLSRDAETSVQLAEGRPRELARAAPLLVVAADSPADRAVGAPLAAALRAELLTVPPSGLDEVTRARLRRSSAPEIYILGGPSAVGARSARELADYTAGSVVRLSGKDRYQTAANVATSHFTSPVALIRIMPGDETQLSRPTSDRAAGAPVLLVEPSRLRADVAAALQELRPRSIEVVGGPSAVSPTVVEQLRSLTEGEVVRRVPASSSTAPARLPERAPDAPTVTPLGPGACPACD